MKNNTSSFQSMRVSCKQIVQGSRKKQNKNKNEANKNKKSIFISGMQRISVICLKGGDCKGDFLSTSRTEQKNIPAFVVGNGFQTFLPKTSGKLFFIQN